LTRDFGWGSSDAHSFRNAGQAEAVLAFAFLCNLLR
jgi:hypothetical protein